MMRFLRPGERRGIHGSTRSSAWSTEFGLQFLVCHINQNALDRFDCQRPCDQRRGRAEPMLFQDFICLFRIIYTYYCGPHHRKT